MARSLLSSLAVLGVVVVAFALAVERGVPAAGGAGGGGSSGSARYSVDELPARGALRFDATIAASDREVVRRVVAEARQQARRLVEMVAGLVLVRIGSPGSGVVGQTRPTAAGYDVELDLGGVFHATGMRGVRRLVLHELGHVVDDAIVGRELESRLDAATPPGFGCDDGISGGCAAREERFAESFAKWATGDIGNDLYLGYRVPPPSSLAGWGAPLASLVR